MASRKAKGHDFDGEGFAGKEGKRRKQNTAKGKRSRPAAQSDPLERRRHRWRKQTEREQELGLVAGRGIAALDDDEDAGENDETSAGSLDFEDTGRFDQDEDWDAEPLSDYDEYVQDEWE